MEYIYNVAIKEEKVSDDEDASTFYEDEEKLFMDAPIKFEYPEDDNYEPMGEETDDRKRPLETLSSEIPVIKKQKLTDDNCELVKNVENKTCCWKTDNGSQTLLYGNGDCLKAAAKPINVACQTEAPAERAEVGCQTEDVWRAADIVCKKEVLTKAGSMDATDSTTPPRTVNGQSTTGSSQSVSCTDLEKHKTKNVTDSPVRIPPQDMVNGIEKSSPTTKDVAITLSLALCKGLIQTLKPRTVPKGVLHNLSREVVTSVRDALSKIGSPENVPSTVNSPAESPSAKTQDTPESRFLLVKLPDASRSCLKSPDRTGTGSPRSDEGKSTPKPFEPLPLPKAEPSAGVKEELEEESSEFAYSFTVAGTARHISQGKKRFGSITCIFVRKDLNTVQTWKNRIIIIGAVFV